MKRSACALGVVMMGLWVAGDSIAAEEVATDEVPAEEAPAEPAPPPPDVQDTTVPARETSGRPTVFGELLFLKPTLDDTYFVISSPSASPSPLVGPSGRRVNDEFDYEPAFRIGAAYEFAESGREVELSYTRLAAEASQTVTGSFLWATKGSPDLNVAFGPSTGGYPGSASADIDAEYQQIDAHVTHPWHFSGLDVGLQLGLEWVDFRVGEDYVYVDTSAGFTGKAVAASRTWGIGPEVGLQLAYEICGPWEIPGAFSLRAGSSIGLLLSETHTRASGVFLASPLYSVRDDESSRVLTAIHARVGLGYEVPVADRIAAMVNVGYEIGSHLRGLSRVQFVDDVGKGIATTDYQDFDLQGVYVTAGVVF